MRRNENTHDLAKRAIRLLEQAIHDEFGLTVQMGAELEFTAYDDNTFLESQLGITREAKGAQFLPRELERFSEHICTMYGEAGVGQYEIVFNHKPQRYSLVSLGSNIQFMKKKLAEYCRQKGLNTSFDACFQLPARDGDGNERKNFSGLHINFSLLDDSGRNIFSDEGDESEQGSQTIKYICAHLLAVIHKTQLLYGPNENSFRRLNEMRQRFHFDVNWMPGFHPEADEQCAVATRGDPRTKAYLSQEAARLENRFPGANADPYVAIAATLTGIYYGLVQRRTQAKPPPGIGDVAKNVSEARILLEKSDAFRDALNHVSGDEKLGDRMIQAALCESLVASAKAEDKGTIQPG